MGAAGAVGSNVVQSLLATGAARPQGEAVRMADRTYVIEDGRVSEHGTHEELLACGETYATWFSMQASAYR